jgi:hypothetical protein
MTKRDQKVLGRYIRRVADELELRDWTLTLSNNPAPKDCYGHMTETYGRKLAVIEVCADFRNLDAEQQRHTIVHELVHCHLAPPTNMVLNDLEKELSDTTDRIFWASYKRQIEYSTDALASALAKHLPLIDWPK